MVHRSLACQNLFYSTPAAYKALEQSASSHAETDTYHNSHSKGIDPDKEILFT